ncbi:hypothetical protein ACFX2I_034462 [Malus domestica]
MSVSVGVRNSRMLQHKVAEVIRPNMYAPFSYTSNWLMIAPSLRTSSWNWWHGAALQGGIVYGIGTL